MQRGNVHARQRQAATVYSNHYEAVNRTIVNTCHDQKPPTKHDIMSQRDPILSCSHDVTLCLISKCIRQFFHKLPFSYHSPQKSMDFDFSYRMTHTSRCADRSHDYSDSKIHALTPTVAGSEMNIPCDPFGCRSPDYSTTVALLAFSITRGGDINLRTRTNPGL